jgi:hypothetical protein
MYKQPQKWVYNKYKNVAPDKRVRFGIHNKRGRAESAWKARMLQTRSKKEEAGMDKRRETEARTSVWTRVTAFWGKTHARVTSRAFHNMATGGGKML